MPNLLPLHADRLPEGWADNSRVGGDEWVRVKGCTLLRVGYDAVDNCFVASVDDVGDHYTDRLLLRPTFRTRDEAIREVEAAYCNARIRR